MRKLRTVDRRLPQPGHLLRRSLPSRRKPRSRWRTSQADGLPSRHRETAQKPHRHAHGRCLPGRHTGRGGTYRSLPAPPSRRTPAVGYARSGGVTPLTIVLDEGTIDRIAARTNAMVLDNLLELGLDGLAERLRAAEDRQDVAGVSRLVDAATVAHALGVTRGCVYDHAAELSGERIGNGPRGRLRFDLDRALAAWTARSSSKESHQPKSPAVTSSSASRQRRGLGSSAELLPIKGSGTPADTHQDRSR
jgi:hypothetical protein